MVREEALKKSDEALQQLVADLGQGKSETLVQYLDMLSRFHQYSFGNCLLIAWQKPDATLVAGFHRWKQLGRNVKKGEKGIAILAPMVSRCKGEHESDMTEPVQETQDQDHAKARVLRGFRVVHVFDVSQTEGQALPDFATVTGDPGDRLAKLEDVVRQHGIELNYEPIPDGALGLSHGGRITVLPTLSQPETFSVLVHEFAHELLHRGHRRKETTRTIRETEAEAVAYVVCRACGLDCSTKSADYIQLYSGDKDLLLQSLEHIRNVSTTILTALEAPEAEEVRHVA